MQKTAKLILCAVASFLAAPLFAQEGPPQWAYPINPPGVTPPADDGAQRSVPGSKITMTRSQVSDFFAAPDWHPDSHPPMPASVATGRKPDAFACGYCHRADGPGGPENANLTGLSASYMKQQIAAMKSGARKSSVTRGPLTTKARLLAAITDDEVASAVAYFASLKPHTNVTVVETDDVPKTFITGWHIATLKTGEREPIAGRIVEAPDTLEDFVSRDAHTTFTAYVPKGSVARGRTMATGNDPRVPACGACHGADLRGVGAIPGIAGRSPSYLARQMYDFKSGARGGGMSVMMRPTVERLVNADILALAAYLASLEP